MTPGFDSALLAVAETAALGYGLGLAFVAAILLVGNSKER